MDDCGNVVAFANYMGAHNRSLPELQEVESLSPRVIRVLGGNPGVMHLQGTNTYILGDGPERLLIDSGQGRISWSNSITALTQRHNFRICKVLLTHWHLDHTGGVRDLIEKDPQLKSAIYKNNPDTNQKPIYDGQVFTVQGATVRAVFTPGHSNDHMCFYLEEENALFTGDTILGHGTTVVEDLWEYMHSLLKMETVNPHIGYPGHGALIPKLQLKLQQEIRQRTRREKQIIASLEIIGSRRGDKGSATEAEIITAIFGPQLPPDVSDHLKPQIKEILMKMAREKRMGFRFKDGQKRCPAIHLSPLEMRNPSQFNIVCFAHGLPENSLHLFRQIRTQSKIRDHSTLRDFISHTTLVLREEIRTLPEELRSQLPPFENALDLVEWQNWERGPLAGALGGILRCLLHISSFIGYYEREPERFSLAKSTTCFSALGVSLLAGAAIAVSPTLADLPKLGAEAVRIALRMGVLAGQTSRCIESREPSTAPESWTVAVKDVDEDIVRKEVESFNISTHNPLPSHLFISAVSEDTIAISGPPSKLRKLFRVSERLRATRYVYLPIYGGLSHAPHIFNHRHVSSILETMDSTIASRVITSSSSLISNTDGLPIQATTPRDIFAAVVYELLTRPTRSRMARNGALQVMGTARVKCCVFAPGSCSLAADIVANGEIAAPLCDFQIINLMEWLDEDTNDVAPLRREDSKIAIVGMSCRMPGGANDLDSFWDLLQEGCDVHQKVPADRFDVGSHTDPSGKIRNASLTPFGCFIDQPGLFDAGFFDMSPREAAQTDPMHRLALMTAYEALEQSGFVPDRTESTDRRGISTFYGQSSDDYREVNASQTVDTYFIPGGCRAFAPGRINYFFKFSGPSFNCDTACSSSLATIQIACTSLLHGDCNMVVAGGLNILTNSDGFAGLSRGHFLSKTGGCKTFDATADGYCRADGIGSVVLKRLDDAERDNDNILGVILSSATNHSADAISITHPHAPTQADLYRRVMTDAGVSPLDVDMVEMHGTGTQAGDATEIESVTSVFSPTAPNRVRTQPLHIGSVKANIGHGEAAAGIMALIKVLLSLQKNTIPKHVGIKTALNPAFPDLNRLGVHIPYEQVAWHRTPSRKRYAVVNNFSAAGGNTSLLLEEPPMRSEPEKDIRTAFAVAVSAKSKVSLGRNLKSLVAFLKSMPLEDIPHLSYTTTARRMHHNHRIAVAGTSPEEICRQFEKYLPTVESHRPISNTIHSTAFVFSGQGSFYVGIGRQLYGSHSRFRTQLHQLNDICLSHGFSSFLEVISAEPSEQRPISEPEPVIVHLAITCISIALCDFWGSLGVKPCVVIGASLGEFAALYAAGVLSASDAIYLVGRRALLMQEMCIPNTHGMLAVRATTEQIQNALTGNLYEIACINGVNDVTLSGTVEEINHARSKIEALGYKCTQITVPYAFHSAQMEPLLDQYEEICGGVTFKAPTFPVVSPLLADCVFDGHTINAAYMRKATRCPVQFTKALHIALEMELIDEKTIWVEIGPHASYGQFVCNAMAWEPTIVSSLRRDEDNWHTFARSLAQLHNIGFNINWQTWHGPFEGQLRLLDLPAYQWNTKNYWIQYNGDWMLQKDQASPQGCAQDSQSSLQTAFIHKIIKESIGKESGEVIVQSDILRADFLEGMGGHEMNGCAVVTSSVHADIAFTLSRYLYTRIRPQSTTPAMNLKNMQVKQGLIAREDRSRSQYIQVHAVADCSTSSIQLSWYTLDDQGERAPDCFAALTAQWDDPESWLDEWSSTSHLVASRIDVLQNLASQGTASRLTQDMVYMLFGTLVDYSEKYRGMRTVILNGLEAAAEVVLAPDESSGKWTVAPYHIESIVHLAGFILNCGNAVDHRKNFYVTPGWKSMRFARPLVSGQPYMCYVKMVPIPKQPGFYAGDVYVLQNGETVGLVGGVTFRTFPRSLLGQFFSPPDMDTISQEPVHVTRQPPAYTSEAPEVPMLPVRGNSEATPEATSCTNRMGTASFKQEQASPSSLAENPITQQAMDLISKETEIDLEELLDETEFSCIGIDSLMSLVLVQRFATELKLELRGSLFFDCPTIGDFKTWLRDYC
ncbi:unnamed protein product [Penicillium salamii]|uniref:Uncharacterized protein n=1 Tax=Penicillium salamii TaxID=1612424 RepID=A0A9W4JZZ3_9EURO|nr:unnamed protein product [Penicillium salamii]CAG8148904.1 unnamed protein product [Penicillium salamii]CAG8150624.1 unnamed protein product [Penicillium salamii]CAG8167108.1 unnamed protein product [Penicillium salamii]CAG8337507.1 unnamed protein product [Penicillium salamii]